MITAPAWSVHLCTALETRVHLALPPRRAADPWPLPRALTELARMGAVRTEAPRTLGRGRGMPLLAAQQLSWCGVGVHVEMRGAQTGVEVVVELPAWDELVTAVSDEAEVWELVDVAAAAVDAVCGVIADGEAPLHAHPHGDAWRAALRRHVGVLVAEGSLDAGAAACSYRVLPRSGLEVLIR